MMNQWDEIVKELGFEPPDHSAECEQIKADFAEYYLNAIPSAEARSTLPYKLKQSERKRDKKNILNSIESVN